MPNSQAGAALIPCRGLRFFGPNRLARDARAPMNMTVMPPRAGTRRVVAREDWTFPWYIGGALVTALVGGFVLAVLLPLAVVLDWRWGTRWRALVQVHGHLQIVGWLGLFIAGMALRLAPRFAGRPLWLGG